MSQGKIDIEKEKIEKTAKSDVSQGKTLFLLRNDHGLTDDRSRLT